MTNIDDVNPKKPGGLGALTVYLSIMMPSFPGWRRFNACRNTANAPASNPSRAIVAGAGKQQTPNLENVGPDNFEISGFGQYRTDVTVVDGSSSNTVSALAKFDEPAQV